MKFSSKTSISIKDHFETMKQLFIILEQNSICPMKSIKVFKDDIKIDQTKEDTVIEDHIKENNENIITNQLNETKINEKKSITKTTIKKLKTMDDLYNYYKPNDIYVKDLEQFDTEFYDNFFDDYIPWIYQNTNSIYLNSTPILLNIFNTLLAQIQNDEDKLMNKSEFKMNLIHLFNFLITESDKDSKKRTTFILNNMIFMIKDIYKNVNDAVVFKEVYKLLYKILSKIARNYYHAKISTFDKKYSDEELFKKQKLITKKNIFLTENDNILISLDTILNCKRFEEMFIWSEFKKNYKNNLLDVSLTKILFSKINSLICLNDQIESILYCDLQYLDCKLRKVSQQIDKINELTEICQNKKYIELFIYILQSNSIKSYYKNQANCDKIDFDYEKTISLLNLDKIKFDDIFKYIIFMPLPKNIGGLTSNFLRISINTRGMIFDTKNIPQNEENDLLTAYFLVTILHESNHFIRRFCQQKKIVETIMTPRYDSKDGGEKMFQYVFNQYRISKISNEEAKVLLIKETWDDLNTTKNLIKDKKTGTNFIRFMETKTTEPLCCVSRYN